jgi:hypothetical protein
VTESLLGLSDEAFWSGPAGLPDGLADRVLLGDVPPLVLEGPRTVDVGRRSTLPMAGLVTQSKRELLGQPEFNRSGVAVAVRQETWGVYVGPVEAELKPPAGDAPRVASSRPPTGSSLRGFQLEARARLGLPWKAGTYRVSVLQREKASAPWPVELAEGPKSDYRDPEVAKFLAERRQRLFPRPIFPPPPEADRAPGLFGLLAQYVEVEDAPPVPAEVGLELNLPRVVVMEGNWTVRLTGSFRLPALPRHVVKPEPELDDPAGALWVPVGGDGATAVLPITLVSCGSSYPSPYVLELRVPSYDPVDEEGGEVTGQFSVDLNRLPGAKELRHQTNHVYAFGGPVRVGPILCAVVRP